MSKDVIVLTPNGRRQKVHCNPDTNILQILEDVCEKQGFQSTEYDLKHHNKVLDLSTTIRFSNLPNKATLEMVEVNQKREESNVTVGLQLEDGERRTANFTPNTSLYDLIMTLAPGEISDFTHPTILYMRQEVIGLLALKDKTLRQLGLIQGRAILRLLNKAEETRQANISAVYRVPMKEQVPTPTETSLSEAAPTTSNPEKQSEPAETVFRENSKSFDPLRFLKNENRARNEKTIANVIEEETNAILEESKEEPMEVDRKSSASANVETSETAFSRQQTLERRLKIEEEVTFLGAQKAIAFMQPDGGVEEEFEDLPDDFYELTIEEVRKLYHDLHQQWVEFENTPLLTSSKREQLQAESSQQRLNQYNHVVVRIQFPDRMILQGVFQPSNTIEDISNFVKEHLQTPDRTFQLFTTPFKDTLDYKKSLSAAGFVPGVHMHFKWADDSPDQAYLKREIYSQTTTSDAASLLASKYRAPSRRKEETNATSSQSPNAGPSTSTSKSSKLPKWFKI